MANPFDTGAMAAGYATSRPPVHPRVIDLARPYLPSTIARALDVGCGAGLSTRALVPIADRVFGIEPAAGMLQWRHSIAPTAHFLVAGAEALPFASHSVDLIAAAGSLNYARLDQFFPEAARVLTATGMLLVYDFSAGRSFPTVDTLDAWFDAFTARYPQPVSQATRLNPEILAQFDSGFRPCGHQNFELALPLTPEFYLEYMLTETNVADAIRRGIAASEVRAWCQETLAPVWEGEAREVLFRGYFACFAPASSLSESRRPAYRSQA